MYIIEAIVDTKDKTCFERGRVATVLRLSSDFETKVKAQRGH